MERPEDTIKTVEITTENSPEADTDVSSKSSIEDKPPPPWQWKLAAVILVSLIRFGSSWGSGITATMKTSLKRELKIGNTQYALLEASENFVDSILILITGFATDRFGGASMLFYGNIVYSLGSLLLAAAAHIRSYPFMIVGHVISALGDVSTQVAQYQVFSSWFAPSNGFASTLGLELMVQKLGAFAGSGTSNVIRKNVGFSWVYWIAFFVNLFTNVVCAIFFWFARYSSGKFGEIRDPATGKRLASKSKRLQLGKVFELPWTYWSILAYSLFTTTTIVVFNANSTELAEQRFDIDSVKAGWYTSLVRYGGFFLIPVLGVFVDLFGNRITLMAAGGVGVLTSMALLSFTKTIPGATAAFAIFGVFFIYSPMSIVDGIRTSLHEQTTFGTAYATKSMMSNS
ncbi:hypothetical protein LTR84_009524 [Exophiala bonariae]|uniref:Lysosomal dipeptide transporter MFSD1 n=1 Tax=Exophiala bonariae TaxID=1690606 RepID=A0AAV9MU99_9EURO|nr:hypothetical protein LTR84_009524 [Exophiala bonariae]